MKIHQARQGFRKRHGPRMKGAQTTLVVGFLTVISSKSQRDKGRDSEHPARNQERDIEAEVDRSQTREKRTDRGRYPDHGTVHAQRGPMVSSSNRVEHHGVGSGVIYAETSPRRDGVEHSGGE